MDSALSPATPPPLPSAPAPLTYVARTSITETARTYELESDRLVIRPHPRDDKTAAPSPQAIALSEIAMVRLRYFPTRVQTNRYECHVHPQSGPWLKITNEFFKGIMSFDDRSAEYRTFVSALVERVARANPSAQFVRGMTAAGYHLSLAFVTVAFLLLAVVLLALGPVLHWIAIVKLVIIACFLPTLIRWARKNAPQRFDPRAVPPAILPR